MKCPACKKQMKKIRWHISYNPNKNNKEYDKYTYECKDDDIWVTTEIPMSDMSTKNTRK